MPGDADIRRRLGSQEKKLAVMENELKHVVESIDTIGQRITGMNTKKLDPMQKQLNDVHNTLFKSKGFIGGIFLAFSVVWTFVAAFGLVIWNFIKGQSGNGL